MKNKIVLFVIGYISLFFSSCLNSDDNSEYIVIRDAQIATFSLAHDSIPGLSSTKFVIDQVEGLIYNRDSLAFGTDISEKVVATVTFTAGIVQELEIVPQATGDTIIFGSSENDSIDFTQPVDIKVTAIDGLTTKRYLAKLNVHQVFPDTMVWDLLPQQAIPAGLTSLKTIRFPYQGKEAYFLYTMDGRYKLQYTYMEDKKEPDWSTLSDQIVFPNGKANLDQMVRYTVNTTDYICVPAEAGGLYVSLNGIDWNFYDNGVVSVLGAIQPQDGAHDKDQNDPALACIVFQDDTYYFAAITTNFTTPETGEEVPSGFPLNGSGHISYSTAYYARLYVVGGVDKEGSLLNNSWMSINGTSWSRQTTKDDFDPRQGVMIAPYDNQFYLLGGLDESGKGTNDIYYSRDHGINWLPADTTIVMPPVEDYKKRGYGSLIVDEENYMFIFGGKEQTGGNVIPEIWRGRINRLGFKD
ncbi:MAG: DUF6242 domain-containing protein [Tannerellaceae bacterium]|nr:DUF6242 domain-containing protein [Tannerellaceae bacterium]